MCFCQSSSQGEDVFPHQDKLKPLQPNHPEGRMARAFPSQPYELTVKQRKPSIFWLMHTNHSHSRAGHCSLCSSRLSELKFQANDFHTVKTWKPCNLWDAKNPDFHFMTISTKPFLWVIAIVLLSKHRLRRIYMYLNIILPPLFPLPIWKELFCKANDNHLTHTKQHETKTVSRFIPHPLEFSFSFT